MGANLMAVAVLAALAHRNRTGEGQWVDMSCTDAGLGLTGPDLLDYTVNDRPLRRPGMPDSNHSDQPPMVPHGIYPTDEADRWVAIACRDDDDWKAFGTVCAEAWAADARYATTGGRVAGQADLDERVAAWTSSRNRYEVAARLRAAGVPASAVTMSEDRIDHDADTAAWGLFPVAHHAAIGDVRVDGLPVHLSVTDWRVERARRFSASTTERCAAACSV